ncbi:MAG: peroxiredoxin family protein [Vulcanimicrobiota bacterium]
MKKFVVITALILTLFKIPAYSQMVKKGDQVPAATLKTITGKQFNLESVIGKKVVVVWVTDYCDVCRRGIDNFIEASSQFSRENISFLLLSATTENIAKKMNKYYNLGFTTLVAAEDPFTVALTGEEHPGVCPVNNLFIIDKSGKLSYRVHLPGITTRDLVKLIENVQ